MPLAPAGAATTARPRWRSRSGSWAWLLGRSAVCWSPWWLGHQAREEIDAEPNVVATGGWLIAGMVMGIIGTADVGIVLGGSGRIVVVALAVG